MLGPLEGLLRESTMLGPDGGFNGSVISFFFSFHVLLSFPFQLAGNLDVDANLGAGNRILEKLLGLL